MDEAAVVIVYSFPIPLSDSHSIHKLPLEKHHPHNNWVLGELFHLDWEGFHFYVELPEKKYVEQLISVYTKGNL